MRLIFAVVFSFISLATYSQSEIGIGIVSINFNEETVIDFYDTQELQKKIQTLEFFNDNKINRISLKNLELHREWLQPETFWLDYYQFNFRVKSNNENCYEVYVSDNRTMWIENKEFTQFLTWEEYLISMFMVSRTNPNEQKILENPELKAKEIPYSGDDCFNVRKMSGNWIEIFTPDYCNDEIENPIKNGWIKWREGNKILINYHSTS
jgi:hypothetical protein